MEFICNLVLVFWDLARPRPRETRIGEEIFGYIFEHEYDGGDEKTYDNENDRTERYNISAIQNSKSKITPTGGVPCTRI